MTMKVLPNSIQVEQDLLSGILHSPDILNKIIAELQVEDFYSLKHQIIYSTMCKLFAEDKEITLTMLIEYIGKEDLQSVGGITYLTNLATAGIYIEPKNYVAILKDKAYRRKAIKQCRSVLEMMQDEKANATLVINKLMDSLSQNLETERKVLKDSELFEITLGEIEKRYQTGGEIPGMTTGLIDLDRATNGFKRGELTIIAGRPSMGKTALSLALMQGLAKNGYTGALFELEMTEEALGIRRLAMEANIEASKLQTGRLTDDEFHKIGLSSNYLAQKDRIFTDCSPQQSMLSIKSKAKAIKQSHGLDYIIIDHLTLLDIPDTGNRTRDVGNATWQGKQLAKELGIAVIFLSQLSRLVEQRVDKRPMMSDLRESGEIEQNADLILAVYRDEYYNPDTTEKGILEVPILKQRNGRTGTLKFAYIDKYQKIGNLSYNY